MSCLNLTKKDTSEAGKSPNTRHDRIALAPRLRETVLCVQQLSRAGGQQFGRRSPDGSEELRLQ
jgi:hypothetical protein